MSDSFVVAGGEKGLPPRQLLFNRLLQISQVSRRECELSEQKLPFTIGGADSARFSLLSTPNEREPFASIGVYLYAGEADYRLPEDVDLSPTYETLSTNLYMVCASSEDDPFIVNLCRLEGLPDYLFSAESLVRQHLTQLREKGQQPRRLSDDECAQLASVLEMAAAS